MKINISRILLGIFIVGLLAVGGTAFGAVFFGITGADFETSIALGIIGTWSLFIIQYKKGNTVLNY
ncbi:hypothetical protein KAU33_16160 [Candidatus Dependentiae bacterium]|nr:hypothetical protein [Candidatus Dependentiae bacterium]